MSFAPFNWTCPHCGHAQTVTEPHFYRRQDHIYVRSHDVSIASMAVSCANTACEALTASVEIFPDFFDAGSYRRQPGSKALVLTRLIPESSARPQPEYIPQALREDYIEACRIRDLSPKASATLIRRCLQGMIRDFCGISKGRLIDEINELRSRVNAGSAPAGVLPESVDAIDHVRQIGNIGAHMEKDIDLIIPVDPEEAQLLIGLVETLFEEWYVARQKRDDRLQSLKALAAAKQSAKNPAPATAPAGATMISSGKP